MNTSQLTNLFRASLPIVAIDSPVAEEQSIIEQIVQDVAIPLNMNVFTWDLAEGLKQIKYSPEKGISKEDVENYSVDNDPIMDTFTYIEEYCGKAIFIMVDLQYYIGSDSSRIDYAIVRKIKNLCFTLKRSFKRMILLGQGINLSAEFDGLIHELGNELPTQETIKSVITECLNDLANNGGWIIDLDINSSDGERIVRASQGLTIEEIRDAVRLCAVADGGISNDSYRRISELKINKLMKLNVEFSNAPEVEVGGLDNLKQWLNQRSKLFSAQVNNSKLPSPKGIMLVGVAGCGKSLVAKTIGQMWSIPILKLDMGTIYNSLVGESEKNMRQLLKTAEAVAPCVLWMDEIEKGLGGANGSNDSGVSQRVFGQFLTWMSEHKAPVFVVATANDITSLPPELSRKGRFDEVFFVDLPTQSERIDILSLHLKRHDVTLDVQELENLSLLADNFSGAELAGIVDDSAIACFDNNRYPNITYQDIETAIKATVPLAVREKDKINTLKAWAKSSARFASQPVTQPIKQVKNTKGSKQIQMI